MKPEIKKLWVDALRSGEYKQGTHRLRTATDGFCCLGVLCDLHSKQTGHQWTDSGEYFAAGNYDYDGQCGTLPHIVREWSGVWDAAGVLASRNDRGETFAQLADFIEREL